MRVRDTAGLIAALLIAAPAAEAQQWWQLCTGGSDGSSCAAVQIRLTALGANSTGLAVHAQNLQGTVGTTGPSVLERIFLHFGTGLPSSTGLTEQPTPGAGVTSYNGTNNLAGATPGPWSYLVGGSSISLFADNPVLGYFTDIRGCAGPSPLEDPGYLTCGARGMRSVALTFTVDAALTEADLQSVGFGTSSGEFGLNQHRCNESPDADVACQVERFDVSPQQVVPEPTTIALLGGGLVVLARVGRRVRRSAA